MTITIDNVHAVVSNCEVLTSGMVGKKINLSFSDAWEGLYKIAVFDNGFVSVDVVNPAAEVIIPWEVLERPNRPIRMGVYGYTIENGIKHIAIPTIYADLGTTVRGADPYSDPSAIMTPTVAEQIIAMIGDLDDLTTEAKSNLVAAINEAAQSGGGGTGDHRDLTHRDANDQHPMSAITGLLVALASKYQRPALGIPKSDLEDSVRISLGRADTALQPDALTSYRTASAQDVIDAGKLSTTGGTMSGDLRMGEIAATRRKITMLADPTADYDAVNKKYVDDNYAEKSDLNEKVNISQGVANVGKVLAVGSDGNVTVKAITEIIADGDEVSY